MACFLVSGAEAVAVTVVKKVEEKKENKARENGDDIKADTSNYRIPLSRKIGWLTKMLWGGAFLLLIEHIWHGEVVPWPPFLTAMKSKEDTKVMLKEISTVGVGMALLVTAVWLVMFIVSTVMEKKGMIKESKPSKLNLSVLFFAYLGARLMWCVDGIAAVREGEKFYEFTKDNMLLEGLIIVCAIAYWLLYQLIHRKEIKAR